MLTDTPYPERRAFAAAEARFARCGIRVTGKFPGDKHLLLTVRGASNLWHLGVRCGDLLTFRLPLVHLVVNDRLLAHVGRDGLVCVNDGQGLSIDLARHADVVAETLFEAYELLERSAADAATGYNEFFNELEGHWLQMPRVGLGRSSVGTDDVARAINVSRKGDDWYYTEVQGEPPEEFKLKGMKQTLGLYLPLQRGVLPPLPEADLDWSFVLEVLQTATPGGQALFDNLQKTFPPAQRREVRLLISMPRQAGGRSVTGLAFWVRENKVDESQAVIPVTVRRHTTEYMRERGGASSVAGARHVAVLGCGSVGSEVADALASSGIGQLTLVDYDTLSEENVFRHALGREHISAHKVDGLRKELTRKYPGLVVHSHVKTAEAWLESAGWSAIDGVVVAIGQPTLEREIARLLRGCGRPIPHVVTWLEPLDLGGHAVTLPPQGAGCFDCLFRDEDGSASLTPATAFLAPGQKASRNLTGCGSVFIPYGALQSRRTALLATEQLLASLDGEALPAYRFWAGSGLQAARAGLATTSWWARAPTSDAVAVTNRLFAIPCRMCRGTA